MIKLKKSKLRKLMVKLYKIGKEQINKMREYIVMYNNYFYHLLKTFDEMAKTSLLVTPKT